MLKIDESKITESKQYAVCGTKYEYRSDAVKRLYEEEFKKWLSDHPYIAFKNIFAEVFDLISLNMETIQQYHESQSPTSDREILEKAVEVLNKSDKGYAVRVLHYLNTMLSHDSI